MTTNNLVVIILAYSRIENVKKSIRSFSETNIPNAKLVVLLDRNEKTNIAVDLSIYCNSHNVQFEVSGGLGHDLVYKKALLNHNDSKWKWIVNDSIILNSSKLIFLNSSLMDKSSFDCIFLTNSKAKLENSPIWYATRTGWTILKSKSIPKDFISNNMFKNFPQLMFFNKPNINFFELQLSLDVNKTTASYWIDEFWSTWYVDFIDALYKLGYDELKVKKNSIYHADKNYFFSIISLFNWPKSFYSEFKIDYVKYLSKRQFLYFKLFRKVDQLLDRK